MPVHDWTRVIAGIFHHFHHEWIGSIARTLNDGRMPEGYYAMAEQFAERPRPDVIALELGSQEQNRYDSGKPDERAVAVLEHPPKLRFTAAQERDMYAESASHVAIRHASGDRIVAFIEIVSPGNKHNSLPLQKFIEKLDDAIHQGIHVTLIDVHPPGKHDPRGVHAALWEMRADETAGVTPEEPLGFSAYRSDDCPYSYFERIAVGSPLPEIPVFLTPRYYVNIPLEETYLEAYRGVPERWKQVIEGRSP